MIAFVVIITFSLKSTAIGNTALMRFYVLFPVNDQQISQMTFEQQKNCPEILEKSINDPVGNLAEWGVYCVDGALRCIP